MTKPIVVSVPLNLVVKPSASISAIVSSETRTDQKVRPYTLTIWSGLRPSTTPAKNPAKSSAVPVAESALNVKIADSASGCTTTGGTRMIALCSSGISNAGANQALSAFLITGRPHRNTNTLRKTHGNHAFHAGPSTGTASRAASLVTAFCCMSFGRQNFISTTSAPIEKIAEMMSTNIGPI